MSFFGTRRSRQTRVFRPSSSLWERIQSASKDFRILTQFLIGTLAVLLLLLALQSWESAFRYRVGQLIDSGILARVDFQIENANETRRAREKAEEAAPRIFVQKNEVLDALQSTFASQLRELANTSEFRQLTPEVVTGFGISREAPDGQETDFDRIRRVLTESSMTVGERVDQLEREFAQLIGTARYLGVANSETLPKFTAESTDVGRLRTINVVDGSGVQFHRGTLADITLQDQLLDTGRIGRAWAELPILRPLRKHVETWLVRNLKGQITYDPDATDAIRREAVSKVDTKFDTYPRNTVLIPPGARIGELEKEILRHEHAAYEGTVSIGSRLVRVSGSVLMLTLLVVMFGVYLQRSEPALLHDTTQLLLFVLIAGAATFLSCLLTRDSWRAEIIPLMAAVMIISIVHNQVLAVLSAFCLSLLVSLATLSDLGHFAILMAICVTTVVPLRGVSSRSTLIKIGFLVSIVAFVSVWGIRLIESHNAPEAWRNTAVLVEALKFAGWTLVCAYVVAGSLPFIESAFGTVTDISLLELSDVSHLLLQELARRAPGTYNHSITVATIGEAAADAIGANGLLVRVGAYFHDIGKMLKPEYFIENMVEGQESPHKKLTPAMSALIIIGHVKDGVDLAEQHNLPQKLVDFIEQHHGTTLVEYFYHEATMRADEDHRTDADESTFRYPGPRPQTPEAGVMMLSDAVESASRSLTEPTAKRIQSLVQEISLKRLLDGQFDECGLTMSQLHVVRKSLVKTLLAVHHGRVKYPDQITP